MSNDDYPMQTQSSMLQRPSGSDTCSTLLQMATIGAVVGGTAAAGTNIRRLQNDEIQLNAALVDIGRAAATSAAATAIAGAAANAVAGQGLTRLAVLFAAGTATMYGLQRSLERE
ncbi:hypothetical protein F2Q65_03945 [Thiohalocapsa marina]|uniref:Uncharacterized protein n=1 Tax=Thiohalocapsa marina TaxID=424902 RepID=A0A5M8FTB7_9GAMM|nr:magnetosome protein MamC [Thiohalocapsa marina]KAA6187043.1 hypothetical protein F2Q65_03945 [Thiohalocapsa marina]